MIQPSPTAPAGSVVRLADYVPADFTPTDVILCRCVAPIVSFAFALIRRNVGCRIQGREIGRGLIATIEKLGCDSIEELEVKLIKQRDRELARARAEDNEAAEASIIDRYECLRIFVTEADSIPACTRRIETLFDDTRGGLLTLSTVHKAKGLEWPRVYILDPHLMPSRFAKLPWQKTQERNLQYVAVTRAKLDLRYIESNCWRRAMRPENHAYHTALLQLQLLTL